MFNRLIVASNY